MKKETTRNPQSRQWPAIARHWQWQWQWQGKLPRCRLSHRARAGVWGCGLEDPCENASLTPLPTWSFGRLQGWLLPIWTNLVRSGPRASVIRWLKPGRGEAGQPLPRILAGLEGRTGGRGEGRGVGGVCAIRFTHTFISPRPAQ